MATRVRCTCHLDTRTTTVLIHMRLLRLLYKFVDFKNCTKLPNSSEPSICAHTLSFGSIYASSASPAYDDTAFTSLIRGDERHIRAVCWPTRRLEREHVGAPPWARRPPECTYMEISIHIRNVNNISEAAYPSTRRRSCPCTKACP